jgi:hypothetical protein
MDKISRMGPPEALSVTDGLYSFVVKLNEPPAGHWIYAFRLAKAAGDMDPERVVFDPERGLLFASEERLVRDWIQHIDLWILAANAQVAADEAAEGKRKAEAQPATSGRLFSSRSTRSSRTCRG